MKYATVLPWVVGVGAALILLLGCASTAAEPTAWTQGVAEQEYAVYSVLLDSDVFSYRERGKSLLIHDQTGLGIHSHGDEAVEQLGKRLPVMTPERFLTSISRGSPAHC
jgi:hypothetical protein